MYCTYKTGLDYHYIYAVIRRGNARDYSFGTGNPNDSSVVKDLRTSLAAQIFTAPLIFIYFKQVSLISPLANLLVSPLVAPLMIFGFITSILGKIFWFLGLPTAYICYGLLTYMIAIIDVLSKVPYVFINFAH